MEVVTFKCTCDWTYVLIFSTDCRVVGPFYNGSHPSVMTWQEFSGDYTDCAGDVVSALKEGGKS